MGMGGECWNQNKEQSGNQQIRMRLSILPIAVIGDISKQLPN